ncbi:MAG: signal peptidase I, partial [Candidatus Edwardsbacteria bacterium]|nr:signal peptidase I [Candidatus Edwardsbacteria bacterium]
ITIPNDDLSPAFLRGDQILVGRNAYRRAGPQRGDIAAIRYYGLFIERVIGIPNDTVTVRQGEIFVNNKVLNEANYPLNRERLTRILSDYSDSTRLPDDCYFASMYEGYYQGPVRMMTVPRANIAGKPLLIYNPPARRGTVR